jgi:hypothetical protein
LTRFVGFCEHGNEPSVTKKDRSVIANLRDHQLTKENFTLSLIYLHDNLLFSDLRNYFLQSRKKKYLSGNDYNYLHQQMHYYFFIKHTPRLHVSTQLVIIRAFTRYQGTKMRLKHLKYLYTYS